MWSIKVRLLKATNVVVVAFYVIVDNDVVDVAVFVVDNDDVVVVVMALLFVVDHIMISCGQ